MVPGLAFAAVTNMENIVGQCYDQANTEHPAVCLQKQEKIYANQLEAAYRKLIVRAGSNANALRESQRRWLSYQKSYCDFEQRYWTKDGQSIAHRARIGCLLRTTINRLDELQIDL